LVVFYQTMAERISFQEIAARGVIVSDMVSNRTFDLLARREVIISAGAFQSPQMLMVSGVGPAGLLAEHEIPLVADRPGVGQNMHDHVLFGVSYGVDVDTAYALGEPEAAAEAATLYHEDQAGPLSNRWRLCCLRKTPAGLSWWLVGRSRARYRPPQTQPSILLNRVFLQQLHLYQATGPGYRVSSRPTPEISTIPTSAAQGKETT
jgi:choline dehydrogenase-like flavoprotein